jgi:hypothetical protein
MGEDFGRSGELLCVTREFAEGKIRGWHELHFNEKLGSLHNPTTHDTPYTVL